MNVKSTLTYRLLLAALLVLAGGSEARAWDTEPDSNGKYDKYYDRPTHFPDWQQPSDWPNAELYLVCARFGTKGPRVENYEVAVYDQDGNLRHCNRSTEKDDHLCVLTIRGTEEDEFHCQVIYGDFENPTIVDATETFGFKTNDIVGGDDEPFYLTVPGRTYLSETDTELPDDEEGANVTVTRTITANEWGTICLPFAMTEEQVRTAFGQDVELADFTGCTVTYEDDGETVSAIDVNFMDVTYIEPNHPYIIKVSQDISEFEVDGVDIHADAEPSVDCDEKTVKVGRNTYTFYNSFVGNYLMDFTVPNQTLFLSGGKFWYSAGLTKMMGLRGYFDFYDVLDDMANAASRITINIDGETTGIVDASHAPGISNHLQGTWFTLDGRKLNKQPTASGIYVNNGRKVVVGNRD